MLIMINKKSKIGIGLLIGGVAGVIAGLFASEKPGKKLRTDAKNGYDKIAKLLSDKNLDKKVKKIFGEYSVDLKTTLEGAKEDMAQKLFELQKTSETIDKSKYSTLLSSTVAEIQKKQKLPKSTLVKLKSYLSDDVEKFKKLVAKKPAKKVVKKSAPKKVAKKSK